MRLTLRTLLAYLDEILEPGDAAEMSRKIEESKFASDLVHRIRNSTRRLRLGTPRLEGRGIGQDPNSVAEYLDNTLPPGSVPELEKVCLESDVHLAEVVSCHQILTLVLGEAIEADEGLRARLYKIPSQAGETEVAEGELAAETAGSAPTLEDTEALEAQPEPAVRVSPRLLPDRRKVPVYMQVGGRIPFKWFAITLIFGFVLALVALRVMGRFDSQHPLWKLVAGKSAAPVADRSGAGGETVIATRTDERPADAAAATPAAPGLGSEGSPLPGPGPAESSTPSQSESVAAESPARATVVSPPATGIEAAPAAPAPTMPPAPPTPGAAVPSDTTTSLPPVSPVAPPTAAAPASAEIASVGRYISEEQVLGRLDRGSGSWLRLPPNAPLMVGDRLLSLTDFRPQILLAPSAKLTFSGETSSEVLAGLQPGMTQLKVDYGRLTIVSVADAGARMELQLPGRTGTVVLSDADSMLAVEISPEWPIGENPLTSDRRVTVLFFAVGSEVEWSDGASPKRIAPGQALLFIADQPAKLMTVNGLPSWVDGSDVTNIELRATQELRRYLTPDRPLALGLLEKTEFRQAEVRSLACRCLCGLDVFEPIVQALNDEGQHSYWRAHFDEMRLALARGAESSAKLLAAFQAQDAGDAERIFRLLWGYTPPQLETGGDRELVEFLEHSSMVARVLAFENLRRITGKTLLFRPEQPPDTKRSRVQEWRASLEAGEIRYRPTAETPPPPPSGGGS